MAGRNNSGRAGWLIGGLGFGIAAGVALGTMVIAPNMPDESGESPVREDAAATERAEIAEAAPIMRCGENPGSRTAWSMFAVVFTVG